MNHLDPIAKHYHYQLELLQLQYIRARKISLLVSMICPPPQLSEFSLCLAMQARLLKPN